MIILFRHGQGDHNVRNAFSCGFDSKAELTSFGKEQVRESAHKLKYNNLWTHVDTIASRLVERPEIVKVYSSPLLRTRQTSEIICDVLGIDTREIILDERLKEVQMGDYNERPVMEFPYDVYDLKHYKDYNGESYTDVRNRVLSFMNEVKVNFSPKHYAHIYVSHALPIREMHKMLTGIDDKIKVANYFIVEQ